MQESDHPYGAIVLALDLDVKALVHISLGGLAGVITAVAGASFIISKEFVDFQNIRTNLPKLEQKIDFLSCREREINAAQEHMAATMEQITIIADQSPGAIHSRALPQLNKIRNWTANSDC